MVEIEVRSDDVEKRLLGVVQVREAVGGEVRSAVLVLETCWLLHRWGEIYWIE